MDIGRKGDLQKKVLLEHFQPGLISHSVVSKSGEACDKSLQGRWRRETSISSFMHVRNIPRTHLAKSMKYGFRVGSCIGNEVRCSGFTFDGRARRSSSCAVQPTPCIREFLIFF